MVQGEREALVRGLLESEARLVEVVRGVTVEQAGFREGPERWSIAEVMEHLVVWEEFMRGAVERAMNEPASPEKSAAVREKDAVVMGLDASRGKRLRAREAAMPAGRWSDLGEMVALFHERRAKTIEFVEQVQGDLRSHFFAHIAFGDLDCYQWLLAMGKHTLRHVAQIEEILDAQKMTGE